MELRDDWKLALKRIVRQTRGLRGRGTIAIAAERDRGSELPREKVFVKISWQPKSRRSESELLQHISNKIAEKKEEYEWVSEHLPALKFEASFGDLVGIQSRLKAYHEFKDVYEERILRIHVFDMLHKLSEFRSRPVFFIRRFAQIVKCKWFSFLIVYCQLTIPYCRSSMGTRCCWHNAPGCEPEQHDVSGKEWDDLWRSERL